LLQIYISNLEEIEKIRDREAILKNVYIR